MRVWLNHAVRGRRGVGSDQTVLSVRRGNVVRIEKAYSGKDTMKTTGEITRLARALEREHGQKPRVVVDDAGLGGGVTDRLKELGEFRVIAFTGAEASRSKDYPRRRDEAWFRFSELLPSLDVPADEELAADLLAPAAGWWRRSPRRSAACAALPTGLTPWS